jgi:acetyltransferase-like isoleucine patch superfamily enzyme
MKKIIELLFGAYKENGQLVIKLFGIKIKLKWANINQLEDVCCIQNLPKLKKQNTYFPHPIGIVIHPDVKIGKNCTIYQNVTIGRGKYIENNKSDVPILGDNVTIYANSVLTNGIRVGNNVTIGAGSIVLKDVPDNTIVAGNPAKIINVRVGADNNR